MGLALRFVSGKYRDGEIALEGEAELIIGRATDLDIVILDDMVSRRHAKLLVQGGHVTIVDLDSTNGVYVNGKKVKKATLKRRDRVLIGTSILNVISFDETRSAVSDRVALRTMMDGLGSRDAGSSFMSGSLLEVPLPDLIQLFASTHKSGVLALDGEDKGKVHIKDGRLLGALITAQPHLAPMRALCRMLQWERGSFVVEPLDDGPHAEAFGSTEGALLEAMRQVDELRRLAPDLPPRDAKLAPCIPMVPKLTALSPNELETLQLALNFGTFGATVDRAPGTDLEACTSLRRLIRDGYLETE